MADILHRVGIKSSRDDAYKALTTRAGLAAWWTNDTRGESEVDGILEFRFSKGGFDMKVVELEPGKRVLWKVVDGPKEWIGTKIRWDLRARRRLHDRQLQARGLEGARRVHAPLQHEVGGVPDELEVARRERPRRAAPARREDRQLELSAGPPP